MTENRENRVGGVKRIRTEPFSDMPMIFTTCIGFLLDSSYSVIDELSFSFVRRSRKNKKHFVNWHTNRRVKDCGKKYPTNIQYTFQSRWGIAKLKKFCSTFQFRWTFIQTTNYSLVWWELNKFWIESFRCYVSSTYSNSFLRSYSVNLYLKQCDVFTLPFAQTYTHKLLIGLLIVVWSNDTRTTPRR